MRRALVVFMCCVALASCARNVDPAAVSRTGWQVSSTGFTAGGEIPARYDQTSPPLAWGAAPAGTVGITLIMDDPDASGKEPFVHWLLADVPPKAPIVEGEGAGVVGKNSAGEARYFGPHPPSGSHHYHFRLFALDKLLKLPIGFSRSQLEQEMKGHVLDQTELIGVFTAQ